MKLKPAVKHLLTGCFLVVTAVLGLSAVQAGAADSPADRWALLAGYGQSYPGWGQTTQRVETVDLVPRYTLIVLDKIGSGWYRGYHSTPFEFPVSLILNPDTSVMTGINFLACYTFTAMGQWQPYLFGGGGPVYIFTDIPGMGTKLNGNYQFGMGLEFLRNTPNPLLFEYRYHHISNAGTAAPNEPLNSSKFIIGITF